MHYKLEIRLLILTYFMLFMCFTITAQDSIPNPITPPKQNTQIGQDPTTTVSNKTNNSTTSATTPAVMEQNTPTNYTPQRQETKPDPELIAALSNNPFALVRDGKPRISKPKKESLPVSDKNQKAKPAKEVAEETEENIQEEPEIFTPIDTSTAALNKLNPFRLEGTAADRKSGSASKKIKFNAEAGSGAKNSTKGTFNPIFDTSKVDVNPLGTLKFTLSILLLGFLTIIITKFRSEVNDIYKAFLNQNLMSLLFREKGTILRLPYILLYSLTALSVGTMIFLITNIEGITIFKSNLASLITCVAGVSTIYLGRHFILSLLSYIFPFSKEINLYSFTIAIFNFILGIVLLPIIVFVAFTPSNTHTPLLYFALFAVSLIYLFRITRSLLITNKYLIHNKFHFFMYLCTVEIAPILILLKLVGL